MINFPQTSDINDYSPQGETSSDNGIVSTNQSSLYVLLQIEKCMDNEH